MNSLNSILIEGNLIKDPYTYQLKDTVKCDIQIVSKRFFKDGNEYQEEISIFDITCQGDLAKICGEKLKKGRGIQVMGRLKQNRWTDTKGKERSRIIIVAQHIEFKPIPPGKNQPSG